MKSGDTERECECSLKQMCLPCTHVCSTGSSRYLSLVSSVSKCTARPGNVALQSRVQHKLSELKGHHIRPTCVEFSTVCFGGNEMDIWAPQHFVCVLMKIQGSWFEVKAWVAGMQNYMWTSFICPSAFSITILEVKCWHEFWSHWLLIWKPEYLFFCNFLSLFIPPLPSLFL